MLACGRAIHRDCHQRYQIGYDPLYRLTDLSQGSTLLEHFGYDATGNRTAANLDLMSSPRRKMSVGSICRLPNGGVFWN